LKIIKINNPSVDSCTIEYVYYKTINSNYVNVLLKQN